MTDEEEPVKKRMGRPPKNAGNGSAKPKRKYTRRAKPATDLKALAMESLLAAGKHLAATVKEEVEDVNDSPGLAQAVRGFELAERLFAAAG